MSVFTNPRKLVLLFGSLSVKTLHYFHIARFPTLSSCDFSETDALRFPHRDERKNGYTALRRSAGFSRLHYRALSVWRFLVCRCQLYIAVRQQPIEMPHIPRNGFYKPPHRTFIIPQYVASMLPTCSLFVLRARLSTWGISSRRAARDAVLATPIERSANCVLVLTCLKR